MKRHLLMIAALTGTLVLAGCDDAKETEQAANDQATSEPASTADSDSASANNGDSQAGNDEQAGESVVRRLEGVLEFSGTDIPVPEDASVAISLRDISRADAPATTIAETEVIPGNEATVDFALEYDTAEVNPDHEHSLRAALHGDKGELLWTTTSRHAVKVGPDAKQGPVTLVLEPVNATPDGNSLQQAQQQMLQDEAANAKTQGNTASSIDEVNEQAADMQEPTPADAPETQGTESSQPETTSDAEDADETSTSAQ